MGQMFCIILHKEIILVYGLPVREPWFSEVNNLFHGYIAGDAEQGFAFRWFYTEFAYLFQLCYATWGHFHVLINFLFLSLFFCFLQAFYIWKTMSAGFHFQGQRTKPKS